MRNGVIALGILLALVISSVSFALYLTPLFKTTSESGDPLPNEGFMGLGTRPGFGAGTFSLNPNESQIIFYDNMSIMGLEKQTITVTNEGTTAGQNFNVELYYWVVWRNVSSYTTPNPPPGVPGTPPSNGWILDTAFPLGLRDSVTITAYSFFTNYRTLQWYDGPTYTLYTLIGDVSGVEVRVVGTGNATAIGYYFVHFFPP